MTIDLFAGIPVSDYATALDCDERLLGSAPSFIPDESEAVWDVAARVAGIAARGIEPAEQETYGSGVRTVIYRDPDGNEISFGGSGRMEVRR